MSRTRSIFCAKYLLSARGQSNNGADNNNDDIGKDDDVDNDDNDGNDDNDEPNSKMFAGSLVISTSRKRKIESVATRKIFYCVSHLTLTTFTTFTTFSTVTTFTTLTLRIGAASTEQKLQNDEKNNRLRKRGKTVIWT